ncbi:MAG: hypothetical protein HOW73_02430 [Polyangiaceae bacterium]|nr:hypothetical protein [Polyangiaceae bacterium]
MPQIRFFMDDAVCISLWRNVVVTDTAGLLDVNHMKTFEKAFRTVLLTHKEAVGLALLRPGTPVSSSEARAESARFIKDLGPSLVRVAMVIEDKGILATMMRSVIRGLNVVMRNSTLIILANQTEAIRSLLPNIGNVTDPAAAEKEFAQALAEMRAGFRPGAQSTGPNPPAAGG